jgi:enamine deaminase RidA (YjgF/YER057c/UK114 family)
MAEMTDYIKIESYLKDVPDSFLMKEIQQATGSTHLC